MTYTRPDISYATKELARFLWHSQRHLINRSSSICSGTSKEHNTIGSMCDQQSETWTQHQTSTSSWAPIGQDAQQPGSQHQVSSSSSWDQQYTSAAAHKQQFSLSSAEAELYAITTGATESLNIRNILQEALNVKKVNIWIHTDSSSGKSMATRIGSSKKAKHMEPKHLFIQQLVQHDLVRIYQDQHSKQHSGHLHQVRRNIHALQASQRCRAHNQH